MNATYDTIRGFADKLAAEAFAAKVNKPFVVGCATVALHGSEWVVVVKHDN